MDYKHLEENVKNNPLIKPEIWKLITRCTKINWEEYNSLWMNSFERELIYPEMTNEALVKLIQEHILPNCQHIKTFRSRPMLNL